jgi:hypothetical protein
MRREQLQVIYGLHFWILGHSCLTAFRVKAAKEDEQSEESIPIAHERSKTERLRDKLRSTSMSLDMVSDGPDALSSLKETRNTLL